MEYNFSKIVAIWASAAVIFLIGFVILTFEEISSLKKKGWFDEKVSRKYPIITNIVNILAAPVAFGLISFIVAWTLIIVLTINDKKILPEVVVSTVFYIFNLLAAFFCFLFVFSIVRLITTQVLAKSPNLTLKYITVQSISPAILMVIVTFLFIATLYM